MLKRFFVVIVIIFCSYVTFSQIVIENTLTPEQLIQNVLVGQGINAFNIEFNGNNNSSVSPNALEFDATGTNFEFNSGVFLTTDDGFNFGSTPDTDVSTLSPNASVGNIIEFDFIATGDTLSFNYIFASAEYTGYTCSNFNDAFGFIISGDGFNGPFSNNGENLAIVPGTSIPVTINTVNSGVPSSGDSSPCSSQDPNWQANSIYYTTAYNNLTGFNPPSTVGTPYNGATINLVAQANLTCGETYHIRLVVTNAFDGALNSGVFLKANSFNSNIVNFEASSPNLTGSFADTILAEGCTTTDIYFTRPTENIAISETYHFTTTGSLDPDLDLIDFQDSVIFAIGEESAILTINPVLDMIDEPMEDINIIGFSVTECMDTIYSSLNLYIVDHYDLQYNLVDTVHSICPAQELEVEIENINNSIPPFTFDWSNGTTTNPTNLTTNNFNDTVFYVNITDGCGYVNADSVVLVSDSLAPSFSLSPNDTIFSFCKDSSSLISLITTQSSLEPYSYSWSFSNIDNDSVYIPSTNTHDTIQFYVNTLDGCGFTDSIVGTFITNQTLKYDTLYSVLSSCGTSSGEVYGNVEGESGSTTVLWENSNNSLSHNYNFWDGLPTDWYYITITDDLCTVYDSVFVGIIDPPNAAFTPNTNNGYAPLSVDFDNQSNQALSYTWLFGNGEESLQTEPIDVNHTYYDQGTYTVSLIAESGNCSDTAFALITVNPYTPPVYSLPNIFTPNGDGANDYLTFNVKDVSAYSLIITNRWGNIVFESSDPNEKWDGKNKTTGNIVADGIYFYKLFLKSLQDETIEENGFIHKSE